MSVATAVSNAQPLAGKSVAVLGAGKMGSILLRAMIDGGLFPPDKACATVETAQELALVSQNFPALKIGTDNVEAVKKADIVLICLKPQQVKGVLEQVRGVVRPEQLFISIAASVPTAFIEKTLGVNAPVVRVMPNTACLVAQGMAAICKGACATDTHVEIARAMFNRIGRTVAVDEKHMDAITALSGSGPAYIYMVVESLAEGGVKVGLPRDLATLLAAQTCLGAATMVLETGQHPAQLKDAVTTPAGCTIDAIMELEEGKLRVTLIKAVVKATHRARELLFSH